MAIQDADLLDELQSDPAGMGYADAGAPDGYKPTKALTGLLGEKRYVANPDPAPQVIAPVDKSSLLSALSESAIQAIPDTAFAAIVSDLDDDDRDGAKRWIKIALTKGWLSQAEHNALVGALEATQDDPDHPAEIPDGQTPRVIALWDEAGVTAEQVDRVLGRSG